MIQDLIAFGAPAAVLEEYGGQSAGDHFFVFQESWAALEMFLRLETQWVYAGMGSIIGLNYQSLEFLFKIYDVKDQRDMIESIRSIERGVLETLAEKNKGSAESGS